MPTAKFALLLMIMLFTALLGDLILLPAILAGPAGKLFRLKSTKKTNRTATTEPGTSANERLDQPGTKPIAEPNTEPLKATRRT